MLVTSVLFVLSGPGQVTSCPARIQSHDMERPLLGLLFIRSIQVFTCLVNYLCVECSVGNLRNLKVSRQFVSAYNLCFKALTLVLDVSLAQTNFPLIFLLIKN